MSSSLEQIRAEVAESSAVKQALLAQVDRLSLTCLHALRGGGKIIFADNAGSFADTQDLSAEFVSRFMFDRSPLPSLRLGTNNLAISPISNDSGYEQVFKRELEAMARPGDVLTGISTGGKLAAPCECLRMPSDETPRIQECHIMVEHTVCGLVENMHFKQEVVVS